MSRLSCQSLKVQDPDRPFKFIRFGVYKVKSFVVFYSEGLQYKCPLLPIWDCGSAIMDTVAFIDSTTLSKLQFREKSISYLILIQIQIKTHRQIQIQ